MTNPLIRKLESGNKLSSEDRDILVQVSSKVQTVEADQDVIREGDRPSEVHLVLEGFAARTKGLPNGQRQIMALLVPGDFCHLHVAVLRQMDHSISTITRCKLVHIPKETIRDLTTNHPAIAQALWWATLVDEATLREWLLNMGQRQADQQMAHFFCEMLLRLKAVGLGTDNSYDLPLTQEKLGQTLGISSVHVNRTLQGLREQNLVDWTQGRLTIPDVPRLRAFCDFDPKYLHLEQDDDERPL